jgi:lipopolysaccharide/colanic/teichoic acid biosynthesis glycosyltransferase
LFDVVLIVGVLAVAWPLMLLCAILIKLTSRGPVFFLQGRLGKDGHVFEAYKFRTMTDKPRVPDTIAYSGDQSEITAVGRILRRTKLDELPQVFNVLRGEMSVVGPRPQLPVQRTEFDANAELRLFVRPGLTGMAQVNGGVALTWPERWYYDAHYVRNVSFGLDCRIIARTVSVLLYGEERFLRKPDLA